MGSPITQDQADRILAQVRAILSEHFDVSLILVSWEDSAGDTQSNGSGHGNVHARINHAREYVWRQDMGIVADSIAAAQEPPDDDWKGQLSE